MENKDEVKIQSTSILSNGYGLYPRLVARDKDLTIEAKAIYAYLVSFAGNNNVCFPSRDLIVSELGTSKDRFYKHMKLLKDKGYIKVHKRREGKNFSNNVYEIILDKRDIQCPDFKDTENKDTQTKDTLCPDFKDTQTKDTNINSINNNSINNSKYIDKENLPNKLKEFSRLYEQNIGLINGVTAEYLIDLSETIDVKLFKKAIEIATDKGKCNLGYVKGIIKQWLDVNIKTLEEREAYKLQQSKKGVKANGTSTKRTKPFEQQIPIDDEKDEEYYRLLEECERLSRE